MAENIVSVENISKRYAEKELFESSTFGIHKGEKIGILGINGSGKSTLLKILAKEESADSGKISYQNNLSIDYLPQNPNLNNQLSILEQIYSGNHDHFKLLNEYYRLSSLLESSFNQEIYLQQEKIQAEIERTDAWTIDHKAKSTLTKFGLTDWSKKISNLSGGQKRKVDIVRVLLDEPDFILMDEPTNHLDTDIIEFLQEWMIEYKGTILFVTHDRYFLDAVSTKILEIDNQKIRFYPGSYSDYIERKQLEIQDSERKETRRQAQLKKELKWLHRGAKARATKPKDHVERVKELIDKSYLTTNQELSISFQTQRLGKTILEIKNLSIAYENTLLDHFTYNFQKNDRIGIIGPNGCGKTSLLRAISGELEAKSGSIKFGLNTKLAILKQEEPVIDPKIRVIDYIKEEADNIRTKDGVLHSADQVLEKFLFDRKMQQSKVSALSGGEKKRLFLLKSLMFGSNFLILDEPTNDLDIRTLEILEDFLDAYDGCIVLVSHDRFILDRIVDYLFIFQPDHSIRMFPGNYSDYLLVKKFEQEQEIEDKRKAENKSVQIQKPKNTKKLSYKEEKELESIEQQIEALENQKVQIQKKMEIEASTLSYEDFNQLSKDLESIDENTMSLMERWEELELKKSQDS